MRFFALSNVGKVRSENQDSWQEFYEPNRRSTAVVVCDGMGGAAAGSVASTMAAEYFIAHIRGCLSGVELPPQNEMLRDAVSYANLRVYNQAFLTPEFRGMGTTLVGAVVLGHSVSIVNVGDSRAYALHNNSSFSKVTSDHSFVAELVARGKITAEQAKCHPKRNIITRALGMEANVRSDIYHLDIDGDLRLLFCTDGLSNVVSDLEIQKTLQDNSDPETCCRVLLNLAMDRGAPDNITAAILFTD